MIRATGRASTRDGRSWPKCLMLVALVAGTGFSQDISRDLPYVSVDIRRAIVAPPTAGGYLLQYELFVSNWYDKDITIRAVEILAGDVLVRRVEGEVAPEPHLHFQVNDGPEPMMSEGLPYKFDSFVRDGKKVADQIPLDRWVVGFDGPGGNNNH